MGTVLTFDRQEIASLARSFHPHGMNVPEALVTGERFGIALPHSLTLVGIEVGVIGDFGETMSDDLASRFEAIYCRVAEIVSRLLDKAANRV